MANKKLFHLDDGEEYWIVATSAEEALRLAGDYYEIPADPDDGPVEVAEVLGDLLVPVTFHDETPETVRADCGHPPAATIDGVTVTATATQWAQFCEVGALVATTAY